MSSVSIVDAKSIVEARSIVEAESIVRRTPANNATEFLADAEKHHDNDRVNFYMEKLTRVVLTGKRLDIVPTVTSQPLAATTSFAVTNLEEATKKSENADKKCDTEKCPDSVSDSDSDSESCPGLVSDSE